MPRLPRAPAALSSPRLRRIIVANTVNRLGNWFGLIAVLVATFDHTHSALAIAAVILAWQALPAFLVPPLVARVEASRRRRELSALYLFEAAVTAGLAVLLWNFSLPAILVLAAVDGTAGLAASALLRAEVARAAREDVASELAHSARRPGEPARRERITGERLAAAEAEERRHAAERDANAALNLGYSMTFVLGPAIAGAVVAAAGSPAALFIDVASFALGASLLLDLHPHVDEAAGDSVRARLAAAWTHIRSSPSLRGLLVAEALALIFFETGAPIEIAYAKATLHAGDRGVGVLLTSWGAGAILGSAAFARMRERPLSIPLTVGTVAIGCGYVGFAAAPSLTLACAAAVVGGVGNGMQFPSLISSVQRMTPEALHGRLMGAVESLAALCRAVALPLGGAIAALSSPRLAFAVVGSGAIVTSTLLLRHAPRARPVQAEPAATPVARAQTDELAIGFVDSPLPGAPVHD